MSACVEAGMLWTECKQMYRSGLRVYLLDSYNWIDFIVLSLYLASYVLRFLVNHRVRQADMFYERITARSRDALALRDFRLYDVIVNETFSNRSSTMHSYFMKACKTLVLCVYLICRVPCIHGHPCIYPCVDSRPSPPPGDVQGDFVTSFV